MGRVSQALIPKSQRYVTGQKRPFMGITKLANLNRSVPAGDKDDDLEKLYRVKATSKRTIMLRLVGELQYQRTWQNINQTVVRRA